MYSRRPLSRSNSRILIGATRFCPSGPAMRKCELRRTASMFSTMGFVLWGISSLTAAEPADWKEFAPKDGNFSVKFPAKTTSGKAGRGENEFKTERAIVNMTGYTLYWRVREKPFANTAEKD